MFPGDGAQLSGITRGGGDHLMLFLHGCPDCHVVWWPVMSLLDEELGRQVALDLRGTNLSSRPWEADAYHLDRLVEDVAAVVSHFGAKRLTLVGHDVGGWIAWRYAMRAVRSPSLPTRVAVVSAPHPALRGKLLTAPAHLKRLAYVGALQVPLPTPVPPSVLMWEHFRYQTCAGALTSTEAERYRAALRPARAAWGVTQFYRSLLQSRPRVNEHKLTRIDDSVPVQVIWGDRDPIVDVSLSWPPEGWVDRLERVIVTGARHWPHVDKPALVAKALTELVKGPGKAVTRTVAA
jgi:pimeloyl-ACP methyl ester carboxylesterase